MHTPQSSRSLNRLCLAGALLVVCAVLFASSAPICRAAGINISPGRIPIEDGWVDGTNTSTKNNNNVASWVLRASGNNSSTSKQIYLKFTIPQTYIVSASTPMEAWLMLTRKAGAEGGTLKVYAAKNWTASPTFDTMPTLGGDELSSISLGTGVNALNVTDYISGPGEYTFWIRSTSSTDVDFYSMNDTVIGDANKPTLTINEATTTTGEHTDFDRLISDVIRRGVAYKNRYIAFNTTASPETGAHDVDRVGYFDVTKSPYNAVGNNSADDTVAIQRAINEARDARMAVFFPPGKQFKITETLECVEGFIEYENDKELGWPMDEDDNPLLTQEYFNTTDYERWNMREFPCVLIGAPSGTKPKLVAGVTFTTGSPRPLLHFWSRGTGEGGTIPTENYPAANYNHLVRNLDIDLDGKSKAIGIHMTGAQGTAIESLKITATGAYAGISGLPGAGGSTSGVTILGGTYGIDAFKTALDGKTGIASVLNNCTIDATSQPGQLNSIRWNHYGPLVLVGCKVVGGSIQIDGPNQDYTGESARGNLSIADSTIERLGSGSRPAVTGSRSVYMRNVYLKNVTQIANIETDNETTAEKAANVGPAVPVSSTQYFWVKEYAEGAKLNQYTGKSASGYEPDPSGTEYTPRYVNGMYQGPEGLGMAISYLPATFPLVNLPGDFFVRHIWPGAIDWSGADVINVKDSPYSAKGNNYDDDRQAIQNAITYASENGKKVFIPAGQYLLNNSLSLLANSVVFGLHRNYSVLKANDHPHTIDGSGNWISAGDTVFNDGTGGALITTEVDTNGDDVVKLADLMLLQRMTAVNTYLLDWNAGANSVVQNVNFNRQTVTKEKFRGVVPTMNIPLIIIGSRGGGKWYSMFHLSGGNVGSNYRNVKINGLAAGETPALKFYMFDPEIDDGPTYNVQIVNRTNLDVFGSKGEGRHMPSFQLTNCRDVRWFGFAGNAYCDASTGDVATSEAVIELEDCDGFTLGTSSYHPNFLDNNNDPATDPLEFYRLLEKISGSPDIYKTAPGHLGFVFYRRDPSGLIVDTD